MTYSTPWEAAMCAVSAIQTKSGIFESKGSRHSEGKMTMEEAVVAEIGIFLGTVGYYPPRRMSEKKDQPNAGAADYERTQRALLRRLASLIVAPSIFGKDDQADNDDEYVDGQGMPTVRKDPIRSGIARTLGLLPALFDASKRMDRGGSGGGGDGGSDLITSVLDQLVPPGTSATTVLSNSGFSDIDNNCKRGVKPPMVALLLPLLVSLGPHISQERWLDARALITGALEDIPNADLPTLAEDLAHQVAGDRIDEIEIPIKTNKDNDETAPSSTEARGRSPSNWCKLLLRMYEHAACSYSSSIGATSPSGGTATASPIFPAIELALSKAFATMTSTNLIRLVDEIRNAAAIGGADTTTCSAPTWVATNIILLLGATSGPNEVSVARTKVDQAVVGSVSAASLGRRRRRTISSSPVCSYSMDILLGLAEVENTVVEEHQQLRRRRLSLYELRRCLTRPMTNRQKTSYEKIMRQLEDFVARAIFLGDSRCCKACGNCADDMIEVRMRRYLDCASRFLWHIESGAQNSLEEEQVVLRVSLALAIYTTVFEAGRALRQDLFLNLVRELCRDHPSGNMHFDLPLFAMSLKIKEGNENIEADAESADSNAAIVAESFGGLVDMLCGKSSIDKDNKDLGQDPKPLSTHTIRTLSQVLCAVSSEGRQAIFNVAVLLLSWITMSTDELPPHLVSVARDPDAAVLAIDLLCLLLRPTGGKAFARDLYFTSSLAKLCNMMVLDAPPLALAVRRDLYSHIRDLAKEEELDAWTCARLERAAICALLKHFGSILGPDGPDDEDDHRTLRLFFLPERSFTSWPRLPVEGELNRQTIHIRQVDDISRLLDLILALGSAQFRDHRSLLKNLVKVVGGGSSPEILDSLFIAENARTRGGISEEVDNLIERILLHCLGAIAQSIFSTASQVDEDSGKHVGRPCRSLQKRISNEEMAIFEAAEVEQATAIKEPLCTPKWLEYDASQVVQTTIAYREIVLDSITPSLCNAIFNVVLGGGGSPTAGDSEHALNLAIAFNRIIQKVSAVRNQNEEAASVLIDDLSAGLIKHANPYLEASTFALRLLLGAKSTTDGSSSNDMRLYVVLKGLERCCHCLENAERYNLSQDSNTKQTITSLWEIYLEVGGEDGACRLICYLDERLVRAKGAGVPDLAIESHEDIDELVRSVRIAILTSLASSVKYSQRRLSPDDPIITLGELLGKISSFSSDLYIGLNGKSGGITRNVFMAYLTAIDACVDSILSMDYDLIWQEFSSGATDLAQAQALAEASSTHLWNVLCKFCLDQEARTFKTTLDMALSGLQSVRRHIDFALIYSGEVSASMTHACGNSNGQRNACDSLSYASEQCVNALRKGSTASKGRKQSSIQAINDNSSSDGDDDDDDDSSSSDNDDDEYESDNNIDVTLKSPGDAGDRAAPKKSLVVLPKALRHLQVNTSSAWAWTQAAVFLSVETNWAESQTVVKTKNLDAREHSTCTQKLITYVVSRHQDLSSALLSATAFLETARHATSNGRKDDSDDEEREFDDSKEQITSMLLSELLSSTTKLKLCSTFDRITTTLRAALRTISMRLKPDSKCLGGVIECPPGLQNSIRFGESLACLCAWFTCSRNGLALFTSGARRWFHNEKARYRAAKAKAKAGGYHLDQDPVLSRLPKVLHQMEELEVSFQKLASVILAPSKKKNVEACQKFLSEVDAFLPSLANEEPKSFSAIIAEHRDRLASSSDSKLSSFDMALISFKDKEDDLGNPTLGKRKRRGRNATIEKHLRKAQRNVLRSRNEVVDEWLDLDADNADQNDSMDAFVDLEDFLVEG